MSRRHVELAHEIQVLYNWMANPDRDTVSALPETQARRALEHLKLIWTFLDRRQKGRG